MRFYKSQISFLWTDSWYKKCGEVGDVAGGQRRPPLLLALRGKNRRGRSALQTNAATMSRILQPNTGCPNKEESRVMFICPTHQGPRRFVLKAWQRTSESQNWKHTHTHTHTRSHTLSPRNGLWKDGRQRAKSCSLSTNIQWALQPKRMEKGNKHTPKTN